MHHPRKPKICITEVEYKKSSAMLGIFLFSVAVIAFYLVCRYLFNYTYTGKIDFVVLTAGFIAPLTFIQAFGYLYTSKFYFDLERKRYKMAKAIGPFTTGRWKEIDDIEYISVFRQLYKRGFEPDEDDDFGAHYYDINLWYKNNRYITLSTYDNKKPALEFGRRVALELEVDFLDKTTPN